MALRCRLSQAAVLWHQPPVDIQDKVYQLQIFFSLQEGIVMSADTLSIKSFQESVIAFDGLSVLLYSTYMKHLGILLYISKLSEWTSGHLNKFLYLVLV